MKNFTTLAIVPSIAMPLWAQQWCACSTTGGLLHRGGTVQYHSPAVDHRMAQVTGNRGDRVFHNDYPLMPPHQGNEMSRLTNANQRR